MPKRYYWLKLKDDFFSSKRIKKLRNMAGGDTYTIIYLKMQLLAMKTDGVLTWTGLEENFAEELALDLDEKPSDVEVTLLYLLRTGLAETQDNHSFFFPYAIENTGSEDASAQRVREFRKRQALQSNAPPLQSNDDVTGTKRECNAEIEKEKEIESEIEQEEEAPPAPPPPPPEPTKETAHKYGAYGWVKLTDSQYSKLLKELGPAELERCITHVDESAQSTGNKNKWKDWNLVVRRCHRDGWGLHRQQYSNGSGKKKILTAMDV